VDEYRPSSPSVSLISHFSLWLISSLSQCAQQDGRHGKRAELELLLLLAAAGQGQGRAWPWLAEASLLPPAALQQIAKLLAISLLLRVLLVRRKKKDLGL